MVYLDRSPAAPLKGWIRTIWYSRSAGAPHRRERVLPNGCVQIVINLDRDFIWQCSETARTGRLAGALIMGVRSACEIVDSADMVEVAGVVFEPGGFASFAGEAADIFSNRSVALEEVWGPRAKMLRQQMLEVPRACAKLCALESFLLENFAARLSRNGAVDFALQRFASAQGVAAVRDIAAATGWSERHFSQLFREQVGVSPKVWLRIQRFQRAVGQLHSGSEVRWAELAVECGYYDQAHFANEFRAFSGIDATTYSARRGLWVNHVAIE